ncbi:MAG: DUF1574 domain-containing protein [Candidatus Melainabacteria bacterium]|nr:MAG: DUF1574 domain-containing protein [Candidatus Melainabacteria bacterium]
MQHPSPTRRSKLSLFFVAVAGFAVINGLVVCAMGQTSIKLTRDAISQQTQLCPLFGSWTWWMAKGFLDQKVPPDIVLLGSSQMNSAARAGDAKLLNHAVDCVSHHEVFSLETALEKAGLPRNSVVNCSLDGAMASDYWMTARALLTDEHRPKIVIIGVSPRDFIDNKLVSASSTEPFRFFSRYVDSGKLSQLAYPDPIARANAQLEWALNSLPTRALHSSIESLLSSNQWRGNKPQTQEVLGIVRDSQMMVKPGEFMEPAKTEGVWVDNSHEYINRYKNSSPPCYPIQISFFKEFLGLMRDQNVRVLVLGMPTLAQNRNLLSADFWSSYRTQISSICRDYNASWLDVSDSPDFNVSDFIDTVHVNSKGGAKLFAIMAEKLGSDANLYKALAAKTNADLAYTSKSKLPQ